MKKGDVKKAAEKKDRELKPMIEKESAGPQRNRRARSLRPGRAS